ncbi:MAG TPA: hypothetical protein ENH02_03950 [Bacteroidetes bacterium]|nr:hypothetical protein [Bacteroidota bacterium]
MNKETFLKYVKDPNLLNSSTLPETDVLVTEFPYCQTARILLTLNLFKEKHVLYDKQLKLTAVQAGNRRILKKHIDKLGLKPKPVVLPDEEPKPFSEVHPLAEVTPPEPEQKPGQSQQPFEETDTLTRMKQIIKQRIEYLEKEKKSRPQQLPVPEETIEIEDQALRQPDELIDEFIRNEPRISRPKTTFFNPAEAAKESVVDDENIVSETLAKIYFDQKRFAKAINIYKKLSLKFPEKSSYFAPLIRKAEEELKN